MANVLRCDATEGPAYVTKNLPTEPEDVWLTGTVRWGSAAQQIPDDIPPTSIMQRGFSLDRMSGWGGGIDEVTVGKFAGSVDWETATGAGSSVPPPTANTEFLLEMHWDNAADTVSVWVDGNLINAEPSMGVGGGADRITIGNRGDPVVGNVVYWDDIKVGTTRGDDDLFFDDFSSGDLSAWDTTTGAVSVFDFDFSSLDTEPFGVAIGFDEATLEAEPSWVRLDEPGADAPWRVQGFTVQRGRQSELDKTGTGTATITLADPEGDFDPTNSTATFAGQLNPMKQVAIRIQNPVTDEYRYLFRGYITEWPGELHKTGVAEFLELECADAFALFQTALMTPTVPVTWGDTLAYGVEGDIWFEASTGTEQVRDRMHQVLDQFGWSSELRHLFSGNVDLQEVIYSRRDSMLSVMLDAADAEFPNVSNLFVSRRGKRTVVFRGRYARFDPDAYISTDDDDLRTGPAGTGGRLWEWSCGGRPEAVADPTVAWISDIAWRRSANDVINAAVAIPFAPAPPAGGDDAADHLVKDDASIATYGWRFGPSMEGLLIEAGNTPPGQTAQEECDFFSEYYVENYKNPQTRITRLVFRGLPLEDPCAAATWALICGVELGDVLTVNTTHWGGAGGFSGDYFIEGIRYDVRPAAPNVPDITLELDVSPTTFYAHNPWGTSDDGDSDSEWPPT